MSTFIALYDVMRHTYFRHTVLLYGCLEKLSIANCIPINIAILYRDVMERVVLSSTCQSTAGTVNGTFPRQYNALTCVQRQSTYKRGVSVGTSRFVGDKASQQGRQMIVSVDSGISLTDIYCDQVQK
jgi:hypothetical protein